VRSRLVMLAALSVAAVAIIFTGVRFRYLPSTPPAVHVTLPGNPVSYLGVFERGAPPRYDPVATFAKMAGRKPNIVGYYSGWPERFASSFARQVFRHGGIPYVQIDPTYASVRQIAAGTYDDSYLRPYADSVRDFAHPVIIGFGHEMNARFYPWGYGNVPAPVFVAAWRHIVDLFKHEGAENVTWLWTVNQVGTDTAPTVVPWWPGRRYVTWVGIDGYYFRPSDTYSSAFSRTIYQVQAFTRKPVLLSEVAVGPAAGQFAKIGNLFDGMHRDRLLGLVWFDKVQHGSIYRQDWRIEDNSAAEVAFRLGVKPLTLVRP
jgi:mannan endo-1,4-beta-mannosidase